jgi:hypothetical protein
MFHISEKGLVFIMVFIALDSNNNKSLAIKSSKSKNYKCICCLHKHSKKALDFSPGMNLNYNGTL